MGYRERKWRVDACYAKVERRGPSYSMRKFTPSSFTKKNNNFQVGDVFRGMNATMASSPSYSMGVQPFFPPRDTSQGPAEYAIQSTMDPSKHPTISKNTGARFGSEVLEPRDPAGPAPGDYDPNAIIHSSTLKKPPNFTIQVLVSANILSSIACGLESCLRSSGACRARQNRWILPLERDSTNVLDLHTTNVPEQAAIRMPTRVRSLTTSSARSPEASGTEALSFDSLLG